MGGVGWGVGGWWSGWVYGGKDTDEATILPGGFSPSLQLRGVSVTPRHKSFMIMQTGRQGEKREQGGRRRRKDECVHVLHLLVKRSLSE